MYVHLLSDMTSSYSGESRGTHSSLWLAPAVQVNSSTGKKIFDAFLSIVRQKRFKYTPQLSVVSEQCSTTREGPAWLGTHDKLLLIYKFKSEH